MHWNKDTINQVQVEEDCKEGNRMIAAGIDCGAKNTKTVIMKDGTVIGKASIPSGFDLAKASKESFESALKTAGITRQDIKTIGGTGSGKKFIRLDSMEVNDIKAIARGAHYFFPNARTVADVGAEEGRAVKIDEKGDIVDFAINEKCAAGAGAFVESMARALEVNLEDMSTICLQSQREIPINAQCVIFAESEVVGLIHAKTAKPDISRAINEAIANRIVSMIRRIGINEDVIIMGGVALNQGVVEAMKRQLNISRILIPDDPQYGAALGAAIAVGEHSR
jgi:benzoyl-CoA reductase subunit D